MARDVISLNSEDVFKSLGKIQTSCERIEQATKVVADHVKAAYDKSGLKWFSKLDTQATTLASLNKETLGNLDEIILTVKKYDAAVTEYSEDTSGFDNI